MSKAWRFSLLVLFVGPFTSVWAVAPLKSPPTAIKPAVEAPAAAAAQPIPQPIEQPATQATQQTTTQQTTTQQTTQPTTTQPAAPDLPTSPKAVIAIPEATNWDALAKKLKVAEFKGKKFSRKIKIAIFDNGFAGYEAEVGKTLHKDTIYRKIEVASGADTVVENSFHGVFMAQIITQMIKRSEAEVDYELHLFNTYGYTRFKHAVEKVIEEKFDLVSYSQVWEYGGNGDGKGFINALVDKATAAGIIWINAAGDFDHLMHTTAVDGKLEGTDEYVVFKDKKKAAKGVPILCKAQEGDHCMLRLVLAWNDFNDDVEIGTDKDLDLILIDKDKKVVKAEERRQMLKADGSALASQVPRELMEVQIEPGQYTARVKVISKNFSASQDKLRLTAFGWAIEMGNATPGESLLPPADNPTVIPIGASDDFQSSKSKSLKLPEIHLVSRVDFKDSIDPFSTSNSAAMATAVAALYMGTDDTVKTREAVVEKLKALTQKPEQLKKDGGTADSGTAKKKQPVTQKKKKKAKPAPDQIGYDDDQVPPEQVYRKKKKQRRRQVDPNQPCIQRARLPYPYDEAQYFLSQGGMMSGYYRGRVAIFITTNKARELGMMNNMNSNDIFDLGRWVLTPDGLEIMDEMQIQQMPPQVYEIVPVDGAPICK